MKSNSLIVAILIGAAVVVVLGANTFFVVRETQNALVLRLGEVRKVITESPGLKIKTPFIENVVYVDSRNLELDQAPREIVAADQERLVVDSFARFRITNPLLFYQSVNNETTARQRLSSLLDQSLRRVLGSVNTEEIISGKRAELMLQIGTSLRSGAERLGIEVLDVKVRRVDLPAENSQAVFDRMRTDRVQQAEQIRAEGEEESRRIRALADREATEIEANAREEGEKIRGAADGERNATFAQAYGKDPDFFAFYRSLLAYEEAIAEGDTTMVLSPDSEFFRFFGDQNGGRPAQ
ncbi:MAG: protease modulator HflC [Pseudomonadota bacterium]